MSATRTEIVGRLRRLTDTLAELKERVRSAVACETGKAVGDAIRDLLTLSLSGVLPSVYPRPASSRAGWDHDRDGWEDEDSGRRPLRSRYDSWPDDDDSDVPRSELATNVRTSWPTALALGAAAVRWWIHRSMPGWAALGLGVVVGVAAFAGGPIARASLALAATAADLAPAVHPFSGWGLSPHSA